MQRVSTINVCNGMKNVDVMFCITCRIYYLYVVWPSTWLYYLPDILPRAKCPTVICCSFVKRMIQLKEGYSSGNHLEISGGTKLLITQSLKNE